MMTGLEGCDTIGERLIRETGRDERRRIKSEVLLGPSTTHGDVTPRQINGKEARNQNSRERMSKQQTRWEEEWRKM
jgi:hypothetical protein